MTPDQPKPPADTAPTDPASVAEPPEVDDERPALARFVAGAEPVVGRVTSAVESVISGAGGALHAGRRRWAERPGARVRRIRRRGRQSLPMLYDVHPEARRANPRELGLQTLDPESIVGSAVSGINQRGGDFLPLRPFRSPNWQGRWQRVRQAVDQLKILPPIEVVKYGDGYWVLDGHNRVAAALYNGQAGIDAMVTELVPPGANPSERPSNLAPVLGESRALRTAGYGDRPSGEVSLDDSFGRPRWPTDDGEADDETSRSDVDRPTPAEPGPGPKPEGPRPNPQAGDGSA